MIEGSNIRLLYNSQNITRQVQEYLLSLTYVDRTEVESDEIEFTVDDRSGKWSNEWYFEQGATLDLQLGYPGAMVPCGTFEIDEIRNKSGLGGDTLTVRALSAITSKSLRTKRDFNYENITLKRLAETVAARSRLTISGIIKDIKLPNMVQFRETDLAFLRKVAQDYNYIFNVKEGKLVFAYVPDLQARKSVATITKAELREYEIVDTTGRTFRTAQQKHFDAYKGYSISYKTDINGNVVSADDDDEEGLAFNKQDAELKAQARLAKVTDSQIRGSVYLHKGRPTLVAGNNIDLIGIGKHSGKFAIESSTHTVDTAGYSTQIEIYGLDR